jgi:hypothetical protein
MTCRHSRITTGHVTRNLTLACYREVAVRVCRDCSAWLSLGPATDTEQTAIEVRAAEIAACKFDMEHRLSARFRTNYGEMAGWRGEETIESLHVVKNGKHRVGHNVPLNLDSANWRAGHLAREIATTEDA